MPSLTPDGSLPIDRRDFLGLVEAALAAAGLAGCTLPPPEAALPYVVAPEYAVPGRPLFYATAVPFAGYGIGVVGECHLGRPTKLDGHPRHPATMGGSDPFLQAQVLSLYDPDRSRLPVSRGEPRTWDAFLAAGRGRLLGLRATRGRGLRILTGAVTSPTLDAQVRAYLGDYPEARWVRFEAVDDAGARDGVASLFGKSVQPLPRLAGARRILALDAEPLAGDPAACRHARDFAAGRVAPLGQMSRLYVIEPTPTLLGAKADHRLPVAASRIEAFARVAASRLLDDGKGGHTTDLSPAEAAWLAAAVDDLKAHPGVSLVLAGRGQPAAVHGLAHLMNHALAAQGATVDYIAPVDAALAAGVQNLESLVEDMDAGRVELLLAVGVNPVYMAPRHLRFGEALARVPFTVHLGAYADETGGLCTWHLPEAHPLESWGDYRAFDGTVTLQQPLIRPLFGGRTAQEVLAGLRSGTPSDGLGLVLAAWGGVDPETWRRRVQDGYLAETAAPLVAVKPTADAAARLLGRGASDAGRTAPGAAEGSAAELHVTPDPTIWDGRYANNGWLQELPKPYLTLTWDNAALCAPAHAERVGAVTGDLVRLTIGHESVDAPLLVMPGQADGVVTLTLGYGRWAGGKLAAGRGVDAYALRHAEAPWIRKGLIVTRLPGSYPLALTQDHHTMEGRPLARQLLATEVAAPAYPPEGGPSLYPPMPQGAYAWGMTIDLGRCIGCNACTAACQAENNIPTVGKDEVQRGREMHWIRVDRYFDGPAAAPRIRFQPVTCMHCEQAPCEVVCPVEATLHDREGINEMVYNRCVGTRYCSNNCPYKVRRFNFFHYSRPRSAVGILVSNPDVSVRTRGVMEKCTYCVQRISAARITAEKDERRIHDGEVVPACAAACPAQAIVFGDVHDPKTQVAARKADPRHYELLAELGTRPRTSYLASVLNPNPALAPEQT